MHLVVFRLLWCTLHSNQIAVGPADEEEVASQGPLLATRISAYSRGKTWQKDPTKLPDDRYGILVASATDSFGLPGSAERCQRLAFMKSIHTNQLHHANSREGRFVLASSSSL